VTFCKIPHIRITSVLFLNITCDIITYIIL